MAPFRPLASGALVALTLVVVAGGGDARSSAAREAGPRQSEVSFRSDVAPILTRSCSTRSCHGGGSRPPVLDAKTDVTRMRAALVGIASEDRPDRPYVAPFAPDASYLLQKIDGHLVDAECTEHDCGEPMPLDNPPLSPELRATIRAWVAQGARDN